MRIRDKKVRNQKIAENAMEKIKQWHEELNNPASIHS